jgi:hypothetical protein
MIKLKIVRNLRKGPTSFQFSLVVPLEYKLIQGTHETLKFWKRIKIKMCVHLEMPGNLMSGRSCTTIKNNKNIILFKKN